MSEDSPVFQIERPNIYQRLNAVMKDIAFVAKGPKTVNGQYTFVSHDDVTREVRGPMVEHGVVYHPVSCIIDQDGNRTTVQLVMRFVNIDEPTDYIDVPTFGFGIDSQDKGPGKAMSYAVKYALLKTLGLETGDDPERDLIEHVPAEQAQVRDNPVAGATSRPKWSRP